MTAPGSIVVRRQLGRELRSWRERSRRTLDDVTETLADLARATRAPDWWETHDTTAPSWFALYLRLETVASELCAFQPVLVHGLFQTRRFARQVERLTALAPDDDLTERYVATRMERQRRLLAREDPLRIRLVLGEAALLADPGEPDDDEPDVMAEQLRHLRERARAPHTEVRVLPVNARLHPGVNGAFAVLRFTDPDDPPVAYVESYGAARYPEVPSQVAAYQRRFERIWDLAVPIEEYPL